MSSTPPPGREPYEPGSQQPESGRAGERERPADPAGRSPQDDGGPYGQPTGPGYQGGGPPGSTGAPYQGVPYQAPGAPTGTPSYGSYPEPGYADADYQSAPQQYTGAPYGGSYQGSSYGGPPSPRNGLGTAALIIAVISLVIAWIPFLGLLGGLGGLVAVVLGAVGLGRANRGEATNRGTAIAGIVIGVLAILLAIASTMFGSFLISQVLGPEFQACVEQYGEDPAALQRCLEGVG